MYLLAKFRQKARIEEAEGGRRRGRLVRALGFIAYLLAATCVLYLLFCGGDLLLGWLMPVSPWPPLGLNNLPLHEETIQFYDFQYVARTNSKGLRGDEIPAKEKGVFRILAIGDSYVYGWGANREDTWVERLNGMFRDAGHSVEVINGGMLGNGPVEYAERAEYLIPDLQPDLVLVCILQGSDLVETPTELSRFTNLFILIKDWKHRRPLAPPTALPVSTLETCRDASMRSAKDLVRQMTPEQRQRFDALDDTVKQVFFDGLLNVGMIQGTTRWPDWYVDVSIDATDNFRDKTKALAALLLRIRRIADGHGCRAFAVVMPEGPFVNREALTNWKRLGFNMPPDLYGNEVPERLIQGAAQKAGIPVLNLTPAFKEHGDEPGLFFVLDTHMTPAGNRLMAQTLFPLLLDEIP